MGIPFYFYNITKKYKNIVINSLPYNPDIYAIDFNGIIHPIANKIINNNGTEEDIINELWNKIINYIDIIKPKKLIICVDGIAPIAKIIQQRKRRYLTVYKNKIDNIIPKWDTNSISPGTNFMNKLNIFLKNKIRYYETDINIIYSGSDENGEGEHKIFDKLLLEDNNSNIIINGLDADLIILSLLSNKKNIFLMRENLDNNNVFLNIKDLKNYIIIDLKSKWNLNDINNNDLIETYCIMCTILGNDFIPHLLTLNLKENGLDKLIDITGNSINNHGLLVNNNIINNDCLIDIFQKISDTEEKDLFNEIQKYINKKPTKFYLKSDEYAIKNKDNIAYNIYDNYHKWKYLYYKNLFNININIDTNVINTSCYNYIYGIHWTYNYYKKLNLNLNWYYPYNYPPTTKDIFNFIKVNKIENIKSEGNFLDPKIQLLLILPKDSIELINSDYKKYITDINLGLYHLYPSSYKINTFLKYHLWECFPILPTININYINNILKNK